jgi:hypothetical protein
MTKPLSPAAAAVLDAAYALPLKNGQPSIAAAIRALADQTVPQEISLRRGMRPGGTGAVTPDEDRQDQRAETRRRQLAIAAELEGQANG